MTFRHETQLCVLFQGDSGGPLVCKNGTEPWTLVGVTSWDVKGAHSKPAGFARITALRTWMDRTMADK